MGESLFMMWTCIVGAQLRVAVYYLSIRWILGAYGKHIKIDTAEFVGTDQALDNPVVRDPNDELMRRLPSQRLLPLALADTTHPPIFSV
jgi:hypothetical protein